MFGIRPTGFKSFTLTPRLPKDWGYMNLKDIHAFDACFNIQVKRLENGKLEVIISSNGKDRKHVIKDGQSIKVKL